ncbi:RNA polymerase sigma factor [Acidobacteriota bacterium]
MREKSDHELMERLKLGETQALGELVERYRDRIVSFLYNFTGDYDLAADIAQETFVRVFLHSNRYKSTASFSTWLYRIGINMAIDEMRKRGRFRWIPFMKEDRSGRPTEIRGLPSTEHAEASLLRKEKKRLVRRAVATLPRKYRAALILKDIEELPYEEVARILNCPMGTVKSRINRARMLLKGKLAGLFGNAGSGLQVPLKAVQERGKLSQA